VLEVPQIMALEHDVRLEAAEVLAEFEENPFPPGHIAMKAYKNRYRVRFGALVRPGSPEREWAYPTWIYPPHQSF
jgi:hypothetical protein